jgi:hypothetical protein
MAAQFAQVGVLAADLDAVGRDGARLIRLQPVDAAQERALAGAGAADDRHHVALGDVERDAFEHLVGAKALPDVTNANERH